VFNHNESITVEAEMSLTKQIITEVEKMTFEEIEDALPIAEEEATAIDAQLRNADAERLRSGTPVDSAWVFSASNALKLKRFRIDALQKRHKELKQEGMIQQRGRKGRISLERAFMTEAKRRLKEETYLSILEEAKVIVELAVRA
jgi:hypothetical protein